jgi:2-hydroxy-6-oxonona-2,4-dienedioate hydrolase
VLPEPELDKAQPWADLDARSSMIRTTCGDGEMVWRSWGEGDQPLVLLHGGAGSWLHWIRTIPAFIATHRVIAPDLPGLGDSAAPPKGAGGADIAAIIAAGLDTVIGKDTSCDLVGFSFGGVMAGLVASIRRPVRSVTLVGSGGLGVIRATAALQRVRDKTGAARDEAHRANLHAWMIADLARIDPLAVAIQDWNSRRARLDSRPIGTSELLLPALPKVDAQIVGIWGARDHSVQSEPQRAEAALRAVRPDTNFQVIADAGHWVAYEAPDAFAQTLRETRPAGDHAGGKSEGPRI